MVGIVEEMFDKTQGDGRMRSNIVICHKERLEMALQQVSDDMTVQGQERKLLDSASRKGRQEESRGALCEGGVAYVGFVHLENSLERTFPRSTSNSIESYTGTKPILDTQRQPGTFLFDSGDSAVEREVSLSNTPGSLTGESSIRTGSLALALMQENGIMIGRKTNHEENGEVYHIHCKHLEICKPPSRTLMGIAIPDSYETGAMSMLNARLAGRESDFPAM